MMSLGEIKKLREKENKTKQNKKEFHVLIHASCGAS